MSTLNSPELSRDKTGHKIQSFSPNPNKSQELTISALETINLDLDYDNDIAILFFTTTSLLMTYNNDGIQFPIEANSYFGVVLNQYIDLITLTDISNVGGVLKVQVM